jgi:glutaredoxin
MEEQNKEKTESNGFFNKTTILGIVVLVVIVGYAIYSKNQGKFSLGKSPSKTITQDEAKAKVEALIKDNGGTATIKEVAEDGDLYKITVSFNGQDQPVYVTKDGTKFIQQAVTFEEIEKQKAEAKKQQEEAAKPAPKSDKPVVDLYVMSFCPYGNKAEDTMKSVYILLKNKVDFKFHYIVSVEGDKITSLHGQPEVDQDEREACVLRDYGKGKWLDFATYVNAKCGSDGKCWEAGARSMAIDTAKVSACVASSGTALMKAEAEVSSAAGASGSPTLIINGQNSQAVYQYGNAEAYKKSICDAFTTAPEECSKTLSSDASTTQGGSCGS